MQTTGTPSHPSHDSLSSSDSFLFSDNSDPVEDDTDVFLSEGDGSRDARSSSSRSGRSSYAGLHGDALASPGSQWACDGFGGRERLEASGGQQAMPLSSSVSSSSTSGAWSASESEGTNEKEGPSQGDLLFTQKCLELQCFVRPLLELLHGLKNGRFNKGLTSFQQSVAMDRIQRIVGVLQKPSSGEKYLNTLLQVEMMLKLWFPQVSPQASSVPPAPAGPQAAPPSHSSTPPHKHKDQLHMPVKKRRLSWSDTDSSTPPPLLSKRFRVKGAPGPSPEGEGSSRSQTVPEAPGDPEQGRGEPREEGPAPQAPHWSEPGLTWIHVAPILSPPKSCSVPEEAAAAGQKGSYLVLVAPPPASWGSPAMQDSSVSSTTPLLQPPSPLLEPREGRPSRPDAPPNPRGSPRQTGRGQATAPPITTRPLSRAEAVVLPRTVQS